MNKANWQVWKFPAPIDDHLEIEMPTGARILCVQVQGETPCIWAWVDTEASKVKRRFCWYGTGHPGVNGEYIGTVQLHEGQLIFHLFEQEKERAR